MSKADYCPDKQPPCSYGEESITLRVAAETDFESTTDVTIKVVDEQDTIEILSYTKSRGNGRYKFKPDRHSKLNEFVGKYIQFKIIEPNGDFRSYITKLVR